MLRDVQSVWPSQFINLDSEEGWGLRESDGKDEVKMKVKMELLREWMELRRERIRDARHETLVEMNGVSRRETDGSRVKGKVWSANIECKLRSIHGKKSREIRKYGDGHG